VEKQLDIAQCNDMEKVLYASGQLQGAAQDWWDSFKFGRPTNAAPITWVEFTQSFRTYHIPDGLMEIKREEFRSLRQKSMTVSEYRDRFTQLSRYAPSEVANDADKQRHFLKGLNDDLRLQLKITTYPDYQMLVNRAIVIDNERREIEAKKRRFQGQVSRSNNRLRPNPQSGFPQRSQGPPNQWNKGQNQQRSQYPQQSGGQRPHYPQQ
jgi:hypothetical protein